MVDKVGGHHYPFPAKDIDVTSSSFANTLQSPTDYRLLVMQTPYVLHD